MSRESTAALTVAPKEFTNPSPPEKRRTTIDIDEVHRPYLAAAVLRFNATNSGVSAEMSEQITLFDDGSSPIVALTASFLDCLYREKIYSDTLALRRALISGVLGR
jgi:hypothetical protein